jgi:leucyl aminopeptidase (aminopeptidase T)
MKKSKAKASGRSRNRTNSRSTRLLPFADLARRIVGESVQLKSGETITIETWNNGLDFAREVVKEARRIGAYPLLILEDEDAYLSSLENQPNESTGKMGAHEYSLLSASNAYVFIPGPPIGMYSPMVPREKGSAMTAYNSSWYETAEKSKVRGVRLSFGYAGKDLAKLLGKTPNQIVAHQVRASLVRPEELRKLGQPITTLLQEGAVAKIEGGGESLSFTLMGKSGMEDGVTDQGDIAAANNVSYIPGGMVWKEVDKSSANGTVKLSPSLTRLGTIQSGRLTFENGRLTRWESSDRRSKSMMDSIFGEVAEDKRTLSLLTIGINPLLQFGYAVDRFVLGSIGLSGFGFTAILRKGSLSIGSNPVVDNGRVVELPSSA